MNVKYMDPFIASFSSVMPQLGFENIRTGEIIDKEKEVVGTGVIVILGIVGELRGNVVYNIDIETAKQIASTMMMGMPIEEFDDMAKSALSELTNMLTATAATAFSDMGVTVDISTPTMLQGENMAVKMSASHIMCVTMFADDMPIEINVSFEK